MQFFSFYRQQMELLHNYLLTVISKTKKKRLEAQIMVRFLGIPARAMPRAVAGKVYGFWNLNLITLSLDSF